MESPKDADGRPGQPAAQQNMFEGANGSNPGNPEKKDKKGSPKLSGAQSLQRLRDRIELTVTELARLRQENAALQSQLREAQSHGTDDAGGTPVIFTESPDTLRSKVESFIGTLDRYIEDATNRGSESSQNSESHS